MVVKSLGVLERSPCISGVKQLQSCLHVNLFIADVFQSLFLSFDGTHITESGSVSSPSEQREWGSFYVLPFVSRGETAALFEAADANIVQLCVAHTSSAADKLDLLDPTHHLVWVPRPLRTFATALNQWWQEFYFYILITAFTAGWVKRRSSSWLLQTCPCSIYMTGPPPVSTVCCSRCSVSYKRRSSYLTFLLVRLRREETEQEGWAIRSYRLRRGHMWPQSGGRLMRQWWSGWCRGRACFIHVAGVWLELCLNPPSPPQRCMGVISQCSEGRREGVYFAGVQLYAAVLNEAMSEHGENMRVLATSKTSDGFWLCFPVVSRLMAEPCGCGSNSCKQAGWKKITLQVWKGIYFMSFKDALFYNLGFYFWRFWWFHIRHTA